MNTAPISGRLFDVMIHREIGQSAVVRVLADNPDEAAATALTVNQDALDWVDDDGNLPPEPDLAGNEPEDVAEMVFDPDVDEVRPVDRPIYLLKTDEPEPVHLQQPGPIAEPRPYVVMIHKPEAAPAVDLIDLGNELADLIEQATPVHFYDFDQGDVQPDDCPYKTAPAAWRAAVAAGVKVDALAAGMTPYAARFAAACLEIGYEGAPDAEVEMATPENMDAAEALKNRLERFGNGDADMPPSVDDWRAFGEQFTSRCAEARDESEDVPLWVDDFDDAAIELLKESR